MAEGRRYRHLLPWERELAAYAARPHCCVQRDCARVALKALAKQLATVDDDTPGMGDGHKIIRFSARWPSGVMGGTAVLGARTLHGGTLPVLGFADCLQAVTVQGGRRVLIPLQNASELSSVPQDIVRRLDFTFYTDPVDATLKALGL